MRLTFGASAMLAWAGRLCAAETPEVPRIDSVVVLERQPHEADPAVIWYDDFDGPDKSYTESSGGCDEQVAFGGTGRSMLCLYEKGDRGKGNRKVFFGDSPIGNVVRKGEVFDDVYWRIYVKHRYGWTGGGPAKMSRATSMVSERWNQAMIAHVWSSGQALTLDPASGVRGARVVTRNYNDFRRLKWLGNRPASKFEIHSTDESGYWVCVESRAKLNAPGEKDGVNQLWLDGRLEAERKGLDWRGSYRGHGVNAVFLEAYWNRGSPVTQSRWYDNFVISTKPIGPVVCPANPVLIKTPYRGPGEEAAWELQLAADPEGAQAVWRSKPLGRTDRVRVDASSGAFLGPLAGRSALEGGLTYRARVRQKSTNGTWSKWSRWHQAFVVAQRAAKKFRPPGKADVASAETAGPSPKVTRALIEARGLASAGEFDRAAALLEERLAGAKEDDRLLIDGAVQAYRAVPGMRQWVIEGVAAGRREKVFVDLMGRPMRVVLLAANAKGVEVSFGGSITRLEWGELPGRRQVGLFRRYRPSDPAAEKTLQGLAVNLGLEKGR